MARVGILGGTFDPPHYGHLAVARAAMEELRLKKVLFIPAGIPPHKTKRIIASAKDRINMLKLAIDDHPGFEVSRIELNRPGPSYTVDTLEMLHERHRLDQFVLIIGADNVAEIETWHEPERIFDLVTIAAANRPGYAPTGIYADKVVYFMLQPTDISSTEIRYRVRAGRPLSDLVPGEVEDYILKHKLYIEHE